MELKITITKRYKHIYINGNRRCRAIATIIGILLALWIFLSYLDIRLNPEDYKPSVLNIIYILKGGDIYG